MPKIYSHKGDHIVVVVLDHMDQRIVLPHVNQILGQSDWLAVASDADGPIKVGRGVPVLAVADTDHGARELSEEENDDEDHEITSPRKTRSGSSYIQNGVKMRPSIREGKSRPRYDQPYLQKKKWSPSLKIFF